ncbi:MAG: hypothetical protein CSA81_06225 [Acidobacteria bacterium]|nr:MAG: hypothetical protein CSA81_06225 [Acidobacteriota bacterium]
MFRQSASVFLTQHPFGTQLSRRDNIKQGKILLFLMVPFGIAVLIEARKGDLFLDHRLVRNTPLQRKMASAGQREIEGLPRLKWPRSVKTRLAPDQFPICYPSKSALNVGFCS